jgi:general secretion pathway protein A
MYQEFYDFLARPFELTPDPEFLYLSSDLKEVLATLEYGIIQRRGFILLIGKPGTGKGPAQFIDGKSEEECELRIPL